MNILIIEDELPAQEELARIIKKCIPQAHIIDMLFSVEDSIKWLSENEADLILMDIHLSDGICFDIFDQVEVTTPIIFTTAYDQYAINAFKVNGIGYILKPIMEDELVAAVNKLSYSHYNMRMLIDHFKPKKEYKSRVAFRSGERIGYLSIDEIAYFFAEDKLTYVVSKDGKKHIIDHSIESLEQQLDPKSFFRITRGCIASIDSIEKVSRYFNSRLKLSLKPDYNGELLVSRIRVPKFIKWLDGE